MLKISEIPTNASITELAAVIYAHCVEDITYSPYMLLKQLPVLLPPITRVAEEELELLFGRLQQYSPEYYEMIIADDSWDYEKPEDFFILVVWIQVILYFKIKFNALKMKLPIINIANTARCYDMFCAILRGSVQSAALDRCAGTRNLSLNIHKGIYGK